MSAEVDIARAWYSKWNANAPIVAAVPGGLHADYVTAQQIITSNPDRPFPYAIMTVELDSKRYRHGGWTDLHRVTIELYSDQTKEDIGTVVSLVQNSFCWVSNQNENKLDFSFQSPQKRYHAHTKLSEDDEEPTGEKRRGEHIRVARMVFIVMTGTTTN